ncbi:unnamed protein product [Microthlaspi erraticum]|uniref:Fatty acyl-CoA reductase n=1 Tax=Microthlaspi erraticum TaxID=1685480 RepID=A0A6D2L7T7_9BRAS|nr:unnamed protein product [Microthlaspi erraticum]
MAITNRFATSNAVKLDGFSFFSSFSGKPNHFLARRWSQTTTHSRGQISCCYRETSLKADTQFVMPVTETKYDSEGIGIVGFLKGKSYFVTGATGFLAKVLIEKLLRASPEIGKIYLLMKSKDQDSANKRLYDEIISSELFKLLKEMHGSFYEDFMKRKLIPVVGDMGEENLGIASETAEKISEEIDVVINSAGRTTFDDRYDAALSANVLGPERLLSFGKKCKKLKLFLHVSTAFVTGKQEGTVLETPLCIGENITSDLNIETELKLASEAVGNFHGSEQFKKLKELGIERSRSYGWECAYTFTKAMGEIVIQSKRGDMPVVIIRPSVIESSYKEPFPGWLQGIRMTAPLILGNGKEQIPDLLADYGSIMDVIPVDMVVNGTIAAMAKHGCGDNVSLLKVYNVTSSSNPNPLRLGEMMDLAHQHLCDSPLPEKTKDLERMKYHSSLEGFTSSVSKTLAKHEREMNNGEGEAESHIRLSRKGKRKLNYFVSLAKEYQPFLFFKARFDDTNTRSLIQELSMEERKMFDFDGSFIDWEDYVVNIHLPGLKKELLRKRST